MPHPARGRGRLPKLPRVRAAGAGWYAGGVGSGRSARLAARGNPGPLARRLASLLLRGLVSERRQRRRRALHRLWRAARRAPRRIFYFHRSDDPYSHLAAQALAELAERYAVRIEPHLVAPTNEVDAPEPELLAAHARRDAAAVAPHYGLAFADPGRAPASENTRTAERILTRAIETGRFAALAPTVGEALWRGAAAGLAGLAARYGQADESARRRALAAGSGLRAKLRHYAGAMFYYGGEWYWGVDRLHHLERRLRGEGAAQGGDGGIRFARPAIPGAQGGAESAGAAGISLEFFPSLRSPYTAIAYEATLALARETGARLQLRPVMPMVMRGVPASLAKGFYIFQDAKREADYYGVPFGKVFDPIGRPVERGFALFPWARSRGRGAEWLGAFLQAAFARGINTGSDAGLAEVAAHAGLEWRGFAAARDAAQPEDWRAELEQNRRALYGELGLWGVPSYRICGPAGESDFATWGQDRLWLVAAELRRRMALSS